MPLSLHLTKEQKLFTISTIVFGVSIFLDTLSDVIYYSFDEQIFMTNTKSLAKLILLNLKEGILLVFSLIWIASNFTTRPRWFF